jgi:hypothetical protein
MNTLSGVAVSLAVLLSMADVATADEQYRAPPEPYGPYVERADAYPRVLPPCWDSFWPVLLNCAPQVYAPADDLYVQNQIRGVRPVTRRPYIQLFKW